MHSSRLAFSSLHTQQGLGLSAAAAAADWVITGATGALEAIELAVAWAEDILTFFLTTSALFELGERKKGERSRELSVN